MSKPKNLANLSLSRKRSYQLKPLFSVLKDETSIKYHVEKADYFGTIATIISLISQKLKNDKTGDVKEAEKKEKQQLLKTLKNLEQDLVFLQNNYQIYIKPKIKNRKIIPKGKLKSQ